MNKPPYCQRCGIPHTGPCQRPPTTNDNRNYRETALTWFALGLLAGLLTGLAACTPSPQNCITRPNGITQTWQTP